MIQAAPLLELREVSKRFGQPPSFAARLAQRLGAKPGPAGVLAVDGVSLHVNAGEVLGLVGESGSGKSTLGRIAIGLHAASSGQRCWKGQPLSDSPQPEKRLAMQMVFQDPYASLNPRLTVLDLIGEAPRVHGLVKAAEQADYVAGLLQRVGLDPAMAQRYPHQFSGGQRARIGIARALAVQPELLICDEPVAALDVSVQAQIINLFMQLRAQSNLAYLFISHDLSLVRHIADRVMVMYRGRIVEAAPADELFANPQHPYTQALLAAVPRLDALARCAPATDAIPGTPVSHSGGCAFQERCPHAGERCRAQAPALQDLGAGHAAACHLHDKSP